MKKSRKLLLYRETLRQLASPNSLREAAGGAISTTGCNFCLPTHGFTFCPANTCSQ
jgi:hypothetical protein